MAAQQGRTAIGAPVVPDGIDDSAIRGLVGYGLKRAYLRAHECFAAAAAGTGLRATSFSCLAVIVANPDIVPSRLAAALRMERPNLVVVLDALEDRGLISRRRLDTDRRYFALRATLKGRRLYERTLDDALDRQRQEFGAMTDDEWRTLYRLLRKIEDAPGGHSEDRT